MISRRFSPVEIAIGLSLLGSLAAIAVPTFIRHVHASRFVEPTEGLSRISASAIALAEAQGRFTGTAPLTPVTPPRGKQEVDPPGVWDTPTWRALDFRASAEGVPHAYSFAFDGAEGTGFVAQARGDLDGDGIPSLFEVRGVAKPGMPPSMVPGMYVEAELE